MLELVANLNHKVLDHPMEFRILVSKTLFTSAESTEVLGCSWHHIAKQPDGDLPQRLSSMRHAQHDRISNFWIWSCSECKANNDREDGTLHDLIRDETITCRPQGIGLTWFHNPFHLNLELLPKLKINTFPVVDRIVRERLNMN